MNEIAEAVIKKIESNIASGMDTKTALKAVGATKFPDTELYHIPYGLYQDKVLFFKVS
jgi:hypothetical protein